MGYNITDWRTKKLEDFVLPLSVMQDICRANAHRGWANSLHVSTGGFDQSDNLTMTVEIMESTIEGFCIPTDLTMLHVTKIDITGEGSGTIDYDILRPALEQSRGYLEAVRIWEGGDSIDRLIVRDGKVTTENVDL